MIRRTGCLVSFLALTTLPAFADEIPTIVDFNGDGMWSMAELQTIFLDITADAFIEADVNLDGVVDRPELSAALSEGVIKPVEG